MGPDQVITDLKRLAGPMPAWSPTPDDPESRYMHARWIKWSAQNELIEKYAEVMKKSKAAEQRDPKSKSGSTDPIRTKDYLESPLRRSRS